MRAVFAKLRAAFAKRWILGAGCLLLGVVIGISAENRFSGSSQPKPPFPPSEYMYIDPARAVAYLSQLQGGQLSSEKVTQARQTTSKLAAAVSFGSGEVSVQGTQTIESQLLSTLPSEVYKLREDLIARNWQNRFDLPGDDPGRFVQDRNDGDFIWLRGCQISMPLYGQLYEAIRQSGQLGNSAIAAKAKAFVKHIGSNPVIPLTCTRPATSDPTILIPIQFSLLASDASLLIGKVSVLGKVAYNVSKDVLPGSPQPEFVDQTTRLAVAPVVRALPLDILHLLPSLHRKRLGKARQKMLDDLNTATQIDSLGVVVIPTAIFK